MTTIGNIGFKMGIVDVHLGSINVEKATGDMDITIELGSNKLLFHLYSGMNWRDARVLSVTVKFTTPEVIYPEETFPEDDEESDGPNYGEDDA